MTFKRRVVVIGGGMAGARLVRRLGAVPHLSVTLLGEEPRPAYNRVLLAEVLAGRYRPEVVELPGPADGVEVRRGVRAVRIDRAEHGGRVVCDDGSEVPYDTLVLATGSNPVLPPVRGLFEERRSEGRELPEGVYAFRTMDDCLALADAAEGLATPRAVVIGGGLLGVSAARALAARGVRTVLAHQGEHLMERQLDQAAGKLLRRHLTGLGVEVHTKCRVRGLTTETGDDGRRAVRAVTMADGYRLDCDLVVLACGVRPRVGLARAAGLVVAGGVVVDDQLRTSDPDVHAVGDCAEHAGVLYGLAGPAQDQADVLAGLLAAEGPERAERPEDAAGAPRYTGTRALTRLTLAGPGPFDLAAFGETEPGPTDEVVQLADHTVGAYRKVVVRGDRLVGGILVGDLSAVGAVARSWADDESLPVPEAAAGAPLLHLLTHDGGS
ncbi:NAD(P)/FAD-dependent oxidoreductase [Streptomyces durbertensis]|uniref:NAD(P)/FAD-dependent oxidoreductase n=1 Tax=Streptomyces durbertensis TaxID=2448886 RepID=A0ABR6EC69_9ACTN|nr:FAD-dependent oxidoreductase [Streptomyces durbertensis]MBB1242843.1 NAD(P)/FAD-dependent oxidoreductase [Streptomyces durbertensis]